MDLMVTGCGAVPAALTGAAAGSFAATAAMRLAIGQSPWSGRSHCDGCARVLGWSETVPLAGYVRARGQCRACGHTIDLHHPVGEGLGAVIALSAWLVAPDGTGVLLALLGLVLLGLSLFDIRTLRLPDAGNLLVAGLCGALAFQAERLPEGLIAALVSGSILYFLKWTLEKKSSRILLGLGDVKLVMALALALGQWTALMVAGASALGLLAMRAGLSRVDGKLPFGPAIAVAAFVTLLILTPFGGVGA
jgi:leader peptidase (prepilin peptidase)/N-methyltransferase